ncbi:MAG: hypothetical protein OEY23_18350 [Acidimicrobiia bacterium]|nr:hypothetical protein [Acidimicrobiia bacterium]
MLGALILAVAILVVMPIGMIMTGGIISAVLGWSLKADADDAGEDVWREHNV